jgi:hypothetical protein
LQPREDQELGSLRADNHDVAPTVSIEILDHQTGDNARRFNERRGLKIELAVATIPHERDRPRLDQQHILIAVLVDVGGLDKRDDVTKTVVKRKSPPAYWRAPLHHPDRYRRSPPHEGPQPRA